MAIVQGIREKVHLPLYDSFKVDSGKQLRDAENSSTIRFFVDVQGKTKLETNLQSASLLPHYNTFEARAMRVVISDLPPVFSKDVDAELEDLEVLTGDDEVVDGATATLSTTLKRLGELLVEARDNKDRETFIDGDDDELEVEGLSGQELEDVYVTLTEDDLLAAIKDVEDEKDVPAEVQLRPHNGSGTLIGRLIYNTVTTFFVGEKIMIQMPTWFFPGGAGPYSEAGKVTTHGEPSPVATFRFAEPIFIDRQQNFRVEIEIPDADVLKDLQRVYGPMFIWVVLDGYMTRGVQ